MSRKRRVLSTPFTLVGVALVGACATQPHWDPNMDSRPEIEEPPAGSAPVAPPEPVKAERKTITPKEHAVSFARGTHCEVEARKIWGGDQEYAWALLNECAKRKDFTDIYRVLSSNWLDEIKRRKSGGVRLVARVIANRGGDMAMDLKQANELGVQLFRLADAMENPDVFRGRHVLLRGTIVEGGAAAREVRVAEISLEAENVKGHVWGWNHQGNWNYSKMRAQGRNMSAVTNDAYGAGHRRWGEAVIGSRNVEQETGRDIVAAIAGDLEALEKGKDYIFLVRFDRLRGGADADEQADEQGVARQIATAEIVECFEPAPE